jgi:hypothetical protein
MSTLVELHYDPDHAPLKEFLTKAVTAAKADPNGAKFLVYHAMSGESAANEKVTYVWFRSNEDAASLASSLGVDEATKLAKAGNAGVKKVAHSNYKMMHSEGDHGKPAPYMLVVSTPPKSAARQDAARVQDAAKAMRAANAASNPASYGALKADDGKSADLLAFPMQSLADLHTDGHLNKPRWTKDTAPAAALRGANSRTILQYVPEASNP